MSENADEEDEWTPVRWVMDMRHQPELSASMEDEGKYYGML